MASSAADAKSALLADDLREFALYVPLACSNLDAC